MVLMPMALNQLLTARAEGATEAMSVTIDHGQQITVTFDNPDRKPRVIPWTDTGQPRRMGHYCVIPIGNGLPILIPLDLLHK